MKRSKKIELFQDYFNHFLTLGSFAEYYGLNKSEAADVAQNGKTLHNAHAEWLNRKQS